MDRQEGVFLHNPMRSRLSAQQVETLLAAIGHILDVFGPGEMTVKDDSEELHAALVDQAQGPMHQRSVSCRFQLETWEVYIV